MMQTTLSISDILAPALAAFIIGLSALLQWRGDDLPIAGIPLVIAIDALTFFLCAGVLLLLYLPSPATCMQAGGRQTQVVVATL